MFLKERSPKDLEELATLVEQHLNAHRKKYTKALVVKQDLKAVFSGTQKGRDELLSM